MDEQKYRVGAYPMADEVFMFGMIWDKFLEDRRTARQLPPESRAIWCQPTFDSLLGWAMPKIRNDAEFRGFYEKYKGRKDLTPNEMQDVLTAVRIAWHNTLAWGRPEPRVFHLEGEQDTVPADA